MKGLTTLHPCKIPVLKENGKKYIPLVKALKKPFSFMGLCKANADKKPKEWVCQHCQTQIFYANFKFDCMFFLVKIKFPAAHLRLKLSGSKELNVPVYFLFYII
jgi:hypothetical protein